MDTQVFYLGLGRIDTGRYNFRQSWGGDGWAEGVGALAASLAIHGQLQPALCVPKEAPDAQGRTHDLVYGHRRCEALLSNGCQQLLTFIWDRPARESVISEWIMDENGQREDFTPVEKALMECRLREQYIKEGRCSSAECRRPGVPSYGRVRSMERGESVKSVENRVALGYATAGVRHAVDVGTLSVTGGYAAARFDRNTQIDVVQYLEGAGLKGAGPQDVAAAAVCTGKGRTILKGDEEYIPSPKTRSLAEQNQALHLENSLLRVALGFYADADGRESGLARDVLSALKDGRDLKALLAKKCDAQLPAVVTE